MALRAGKDDLMNVIRDGDSSSLRAWFLSQYLAGKRVKPQWSHLEAAIVHGKDDIARILIAHGAVPSRGTYNLLLAEQQQHLRRLGLETRRLPEGSGIPSLISLPRAWLNRLDAVQAAGADEALIAGGALYDTFNGKPVKDVDIFLLDRGRANMRLLKQVFKGYDIHVLPQEYRLRFRQFQGSFGHVDLLVNYVSAIAQDPEGRHPPYNLTFIGFDLATKPDFTRRIIALFDVGICQVATDGTCVLTSRQYVEDVAARRLAPTHTGTPSSAHVTRLAYKYPDWEIHKDLKQYLPVQSHQSFTRR